MTLLNVSHLSKSYGNLQAVDDVSFLLEAGQTLGLIGPNGAGKSSIVGMLCGLVRPDGGTVQIAGEVVGSGRNDVKRKIGLVPQDLALYEDLSARDNLRLFAGLYGLNGARNKARCDEVLELVKLSERAGDKPQTFSGGMKRRLNIAAALMHDPQLLILDEPTVGVDPQSRNAIFDTLERLKQSGCSLIYTSHYMEEVERLADHIVVIDHGRVLVDETPATLYARLPAQAALALTLAAAPDAALIAGLQALSGVDSVTPGVADPCQLQIGLHTAEAALPVMAWLAQQSCRVVHFATARTNLEDIFLSLTGRSLRD